MLPKKSGVYMIRNKINGMMYIGSSKNMQMRFRDHKKPCRTHKLAEAIKNHGISSFESVVLELVEDESLLKEREQYYIDKYKPFYKDNKGYNKSPKSDSQRGFKWSDEQRLAKCIKINQYSLSGEFLDVWDGLAVVENDLGIDHSKVSMCIHGKRRSAGGYQWRLTTDTTPVKSVDGPSKPVSISMFSVNGEHIKDFHSYYNAARTLFPDLNDDKQISKKAGKSA